MTKPVSKSSKLSAALPTDYAPLLAEIKARVQSARIKVGLAANRELLALYWEVGRLILDRQKLEGWGAKVIDRLALDLQRAFPGQQGFSPRNLKYMRAFAGAWPETAMVQQADAPLGHPGKSEPAIVQEPLARISALMSPIVQAPLAQLSWYHHLALIDKLSSPEDRLWYAAKTVEHGWSRNVLALQIEAGLHQRQGKAVTNFKATLPPAQSDLAQGITKDPYLFDFLTLRCFVVIDLNARDFTPEAAGKMNFYLSAVDDRFRQAGDQPSIGLILCRSNNRVTAEYALRDMTKPIGVSGYVTKLVESLPEGLKGVVPSVAELEKGLAQE